MMRRDLTKLSTGFSKLSRHERLMRLVSMGLLTTEDLRFLSSGSPVDVKLAEHLIENVIGFFHIPMGVAANFRIDGQDYMIPMAVEETSIVAAASKTAKWVKEHGGIQTQSLGKRIIGQVQLPKVRSVERVRRLITENRRVLLETANKLAEGLVRRGGGVQEFEVREVDRGDGEYMAVVHVLADPCDAMGANIINQVCEGLKSPIEKITGERVGLCILSNLVDTRLTRAEITISQIDPEVGEGISEASLFAKQDPYRAATNNKGVLNGIDGVLVATGNDWRAVEAGVHAYAARSGQYRSITHWEMRGPDLVGSLVAPLVVGTVGGVTAVHPTAKMCLRMLGVQKSEELSRILAAVGLVQNLGALRALSTVGVVAGHMKLHAANLALAAGATNEEIPDVQIQLEGLLERYRRVSLSQAREVLEGLRRKSDPRTI